MTRHKYNFRVRHDAEWDTDYVGMKCLHCDYEEEMELDILLECSDPSVEESPVVDCPSCGHALLVPKDVYDQIKGGFIYKPEEEQSQTGPGRPVFLWGRSNTIS